MLANRDVMAYLDKVIDLCSPLNPGPAEGGAIDGTIGPNFHIVINLDNPHLRDLDVPSLLILCEAIAVASYHRPTVNDDSTTDYAAVKDRCIGVDEAMVTHFDSGTKVGPSIDPRPLAYPAIGSEMG
jgi:hypothetical protein